ncbi:fimbrial protein [Salmonella enterica]|nr:fimbrial protein [Salmonella enterica]
MKKTLIALAVAASAVVSGSAMAAWTPDFVGNGEVNLGGTLTPQDVVTPWEVQVGTNVNNLNANIQKGLSFVDVPVSTSIPFVGIRTKVSKAFAAGTGYNPNINYGNAVDLKTFVDGVTTLTLDVRDASDKKIGTLTAPFSAAGVMSWKAADGQGGASGVWAINSNRMFDGGVSETPDGASKQSDVLAKTIMPDIAEHFDSQGYTIEGISWSGTSTSGSTYSGYYAGGIAAGSSIRLKLDTAATGDEAITWKASMPITISYQ